MSLILNKALNFVPVLITELNRAIGQLSTKKSSLRLQMKIKTFSVSGPLRLLFTSAGHENIILTSFFTTGFPKGSKIATTKLHSA